MSAYNGPDYMRWLHERQRHHARFKAYVKQHGLPCQDCGGRGGHVETICELGGPWYDCGWCEGTAKVTRWLRGQWLRCMREEKRARDAKKRQRAA
jgi:hypothetical protein